MTHVYTTSGQEISVWDALGRLVWGPSSGPPDSDPEIPDDPQTIAEQIAAARPTTFVRTWDIAQDGSKQFATIADAVNAARAVIVAENGTRQPSRLSPYRRHRFRIWPGEYKEPNPAFPSHFALIGMGDEPEDVRIWDDRGYAGTGGTNPDGSKSGENIINSSGKSMWVENVWLDHQSDDPEWHSLRIVGPSGTIGENGYTRMTAVFSKVRMTSAFDGMAGKCAFDATISHYDTVLDRVWFDTPGQGQAINAHIGYNAASTSSLIFHGCKVTAGYNFVPDPTLPNDGYFPDGSMPGSIPVGLHAPQAGGDSLYWVETEDSLWDVGRKQNAPEVPPRGAIAAVMYNTSTASFHISDLPQIDPESPRLLISDPHEGWLIDQDEYALTGTLDRIIPDLIPVLGEIRDGTSGAERDFYGLNPTTHATPEVISAAGTQQTVTLPAGRVYFVPIDLPETEFQARSVRFELAGAGQVGIATAYAHPTTGVPYSTAIGQLWKSGGVNASAGQASVSPRWYYPGHGQMWVAIGTEGATGHGAVTAEGGPTVYYADGYEGGTVPDMPELSVLAVGEPYPLVSVART